MILDFLLTGNLYSSYSTWTHSSHQICIVFTFPISVKLYHYSPTCPNQKLRSYLRYISLTKHTQSIPVLYLVTQSCPTICNPMDCSPPGSSIHGDSPGKNTRVDCHALLQGIFPTQGLNLPPTLQADSLLSEPPGKPIPFPGDLPKIPRNRTRVSCTAGGFFTSWASREAF